MTCPHCLLHLLAIACSLVTEVSMHSMDPVATGTEYLIQEAEMYYSDVILDTILQTINVMLHVICSPKAEASY